MKTTTLRHEGSALYSLALTLCRATLEAARTEIQIINSRLRHHSIYLVEHITSSLRASTPASRAQSIQFARIRISKLAAVLDAAWCERLVTDEKRSDIREVIEQLENELDATLHFEIKPGAVIQKSGPTETRMRARPPISSLKENPLTGDDLSELESLVQRDLKRAAEIHSNNRDSPTSTSELAGLSSTA